MDMYAKCGRLPDARRLLDETPRGRWSRGTAWSQCTQERAQAEESVALFSAMRRVGLRPNGSTLVGVLSECGDSM
jgi:hypothetical protein